MNRRRNRLEGSHLFMRSRNREIEKALRLTEGSVEKARQVAGYGKGNHVSTFGELFLKGEAPGKFAVNQVSWDPVQI